MMIKNIHQIQSSCEYCCISSLFFPAVYHIIIRARFQNHAQSQVEIINIGMFILNIHAGSDISCRMAIMNLAKNVVIIQCFLKCELFKQCMIICIIQRSC